MGYELGPNECIIMRHDSVKYKGSNYRNELILTNQNLVLVEKGVFKGIKDIYVFPLREIKKYNGEAQAIMSKGRDGFQHLQVYFINGMQDFGFELGRFEIRKWIDAINKTVMGKDYKPSSSSTTSTIGNGLGILSGMVKDTMKDVLGVDVKLPPLPSSSVTTKCCSCKAPLVGKKGEIVRCKYCDTEQSIQ